MATRRRTRPAREQKISPLQGIVMTALDDMKAANVKVLDVQGLTDIADTLVIASGTSDRHVRSIADRVVERAKQSGHRPFGVEGARDGEWVLVDLHDIVVHVMLPRVREFYGLEQLWEPIDVKPAVLADAKPAATKTPRTSAPRKTTKSRSAAPRRPATRRPPPKKAN